ncbi:hypothetical protein GCM10028808_14980 [Spirosoma migulaei]
MSALNLGLAGYALLAPGLTANLPMQGVGIYISHVENVLGTSFTLKALANSYTAAQRAEQAALAEIDRLSQVLSSHRPDSEFSQWLNSNDTAVPVSSDLFAVLGQFDRWLDLTGGVINASAEHISQLWQQAAKQNALPSEANLGMALATTQQRYWLLDPANQTATRLSQASLRLHTFAKSYVLDRAAEAALGVADVQAVVLNGGGDLVIRGNWTEPVTMANPRASAENSEPLARIAIQNQAVATSGNYRRGVAVDGTWYSHIIDPRTGQPANAIASATVVHPDAVTAGALATAFNILTPIESAQLATTIPNTEFFIVTSDGLQHPSPGWNGLAMPAQLVTNKIETARLMSVSPQKDKLWNPDQELLINFELPLFQGRSHRPFVAVWIEDENGKPVRNLALWYNKPRWLPELRDFYAMQRNADFDANSISSATRSPGEYSLQWDGKDNAGQYVKQAKYTICIEAAREHGSYQIIRQAMDFNGKLKQQTLPGNVEIATAALDYRKKGDAR